jgi:hypothetical protein
MRINSLSREREMSGHMTSRNAFTVILLCGLTTFSLANTSDDKKSANRQETAVVASKVTPRTEIPKVVGATGKGTAKGKEKMGVADDSLRPQRKQ